MNLPGAEAAWDQAWRGTKRELAALALEAAAKGWEDAGRKGDAQ